MRFYVSVGLFFLMKRIIVRGKENIPKEGPVLFIGNHQNAMIDAILIPTTNGRITHFLARASAFKNKLAASILSTMNMIPVYRIRDGVNTIEKNKAIFQQCFEFLKKGRAVEIFAEGEHHRQRRILPLKKGFARIIEGTLRKYPDLSIKIVPVGLNYDTTLKYPSSVSVIYGPPIVANNFIDPNADDPTYKAILVELRKAMERLTLHVDDDLPYQATIEKLNANDVDYVNPDKAKELMAKLEDLPDNPEQKRRINWLAPYHWLTKLNSLIPWLIWRWLKGKIKEPLFTNTFRFAVITTLFPLFYLLQAYVVKIYLGTTTALWYLAACIVLGIITTKTTPVRPE
jgi:1-acyl-sn-glycerol-3-phosphate acyltransferase